MNLSCRKSCPLCGTKEAEVRLRELEKQIPEVLAMLHQEREAKKAKAATGG